jgi:hypothetical protein
VIFGQFALEAAIERLPYFRMTRFSGSGSAPTMSMNDCFPENKLKNHHQNWADHRANLLDSGACPGHDPGFALDLIQGSPE